MTKMYMMLRPVDIAVLLKLCLPEAEHSSFQRLASELHLASSEVHGAVKRAQISGLIRHDGPKKVNRSGMMELLAHGLKYLYPVSHGPLTRGVPTSYAAEPLKSVIHASEHEIPVWPHPSGTVRGYALEPLYKHAAAASLDDPAFYELLALADAIRDGRVRERAIALKLLEERLQTNV